MGYAETWKNKGAVENVEAMLLKRLGMKQDPEVQRVGMDIGIKGMKRAAESMNIVVVGVASWRFLLLRKTDSWLQTVQDAWKVRCGRRREAGRHGRDTLGRLSGAERLLQARPGHQQLRRGCAPERAGGRLGQGRRRTCRRARTRRLS